jgi:urease accessory protein
MKCHSWKVLFAGSLFALAIPVEAHTGQDLAHDLQAGFWHPLLGIDHILAMMGVGLWAGFLGGAARGWLPAVFLVSMAAGASSHFAGMVVQGAEIAVAMSVLAIGVILILGCRLRPGWAASLSALFAYSHGYVHALETAADSQVLWYAGGFIMSTALLLGVGVVVGLVSVGRSRWVKYVFGVISAGAGITLLLGA